MASLFSPGRIGSLEVNSGLRVGDAHAWLYDLRGTSGARCGDCGVGLAYC